MATIGFTWKPNAHNLLTVFYSRDIKGIGSTAGQTIAVTFTYVYAADKNLAKKFRIYRDVLLLLSMREFMRHIPSRHFSKMTNFK